VVPEELGVAVAELQYVATMIDRKLRKSLRATILVMPDAALYYLREEVAREQNRRRLQTRDRRKRARIESQAILPA